MNHRIELECPYCGSHFEMPLEVPTQSLSYRDVACVPYIRDIGRFDKSGWSRIGADFFNKLVAWDQEVGILRVPAGGQVDVWYSVVTCKVCGSPFDVYVNFTPDMNLPDIWPHLFGRENGEIKLYGGETVVTHLLSLIAAKRVNAWVAAFILSIGLFIATSIPEFILWLLGKDNTTTIYVNLLLRFTGSIVLTVLLFNFKTYIDFIRRDREFCALFSVAKQEHVTFWRNFTLARFVGVQSPENNYPSRLTQPAIVAGIPSASILFLSWVAYQLNQIGRNAFYEILTSLFVFFVGYVAASAVTRLGKQQPNPDMLLLPINGRRLLGGLLAMGLWLVIILIRMVLQKPWWEVIIGFLALLFWITLAYYFGVTAYFSFNSLTYIVWNFAKLPLNLNPLDHFRSLNALKRLSGFSLRGLVTPALFLLLLSAIFNLPKPHFVQDALTQSEWIFIWAETALFALFIVLGISVSRKILLAAITYLSAMVMMPLILRSSIALCSVHNAPTLCLLTHPSLTLRVVSGFATFNVYPELLLLGIVLSFILYLHATALNKTIYQIRNRYKYKAILELEKKIRELLEELRQTSSKHAGEVASLSDCINNLLSLRDYMERQSDRVDISNYLGIFSPLLTTIILTALETYVQKLLA